MTNTQPIAQKGGAIIDSGAHITGIGTALPDNVVTNDDLAARIDTTDEWITERTGIKQRHIGETTAKLATAAATKAMTQAAVDAASIDLLVLATTTPDRRVPSTASTVQENLGLTCGAMDINAACSGFVYSLVTAHGFCAMGYNRVLVVGAETVHRLLDWDDRSTCILFGDGAGAVVLERDEKPGDLLGWHLSSDGSMEETLYCNFDGPLIMAGQTVFKKAVLVMEDAARHAMKQAGLGPDDIDVIVPHQANIRIVETACKRLEIPIEKAAMVIHRTGNTSSASIPLALEDAARTGKIQNGHNVLLVGFGAGMSSAAALVNWSAN